MTERQKDRKTERQRDKVFVKNDLLTYEESTWPARACVCIKGVLILMEDR